MADGLAIFGFAFTVCAEVHPEGGFSPSEDLDDVLLFPRFNNDFLFYLLDHMSDRLGIMMNYGGLIDVDSLNDSHEIL